MKIKTRTKRQLLSWCRVMSHKKVFRNYTWMKDCTNISWKWMAMKHDSLIKASAIISKGERGNKYYFWVFINNLLHCEGELYDTSFYCRLFHWELEFFSFFLIWAITNIYISRIFFRFFKYEILVKFRICHILRSRIVVNLTDNVITPRLDVAIFHFEDLLLCESFGESHATENWNGKNRSSI